MPKNLKWDKKSRLPHVLEVMGLKKQPIIGNFDEIIIGCK